MLNGYMAMPSSLLACQPFRLLASYYSLNYFVYHSFNFVATKVRLFFDLAITSLLLFLFIAPISENNLSSFADLPPAGFLVAIRQAAPKPL